MKFKYIYIKNYRCFKNFELSFDNYNSLYKKIYNNMNLNIIIGENGSGKSTLLSFIADVFHNLERFPDRISSNFIFIYSLHNNLGDITLEVNYPILKISSKQQNFKFNFTKTYNEIYISPREAYQSYKFLLPCKVSVSSFSIDSFFPKEFPHNYCGERIVTFNTIDSYNVKARKSLNLTRGIILFYKKYSDVNFKNNLKNILDLSFNNSVMFKSKCENWLYDDDISTLYIKYENELSNFFNFDSFSNLLKSNSFFDLFIDYESEPYAQLNISKLIFHEHTFYYKILLELSQLEVIFINDIFINKNGISYSFLDLSSGEKSFIYRILGSLSNAYDNSLIIFDELETHLNVIWIRQIIWFIKELFSEFNSQIFISTHSHLFINSVFSENLIFLKNFNHHHVDLPIFLSNESEIFKILFPDQNPLSLLEKDVIKIFSSGIKLDESYNLFGNSYLKFLLFTKLQNEDDDND